MKSLAETMYAEEGKAAFIRSNTDAQISPEKAEALWEKYSPAARWSWCRIAQAAIAAHRVKGLKQ